MILDFFPHIKYQAHYKFVSRTGQQSFSQLSVRNRIAELMLACFFLKISSLVQILTFSKIAEKVSFF